MDLNKNISDMMPWYVNNTLDEASRRRLENVLKNSPSSQAEVSWLQSLRAQIQGDKDQRQLPPSDAGLDRLMARIAAEQSGKVTSITPVAKTAASWYKPAFAIAASIVFAQVIGLHMLLNDGSGADTLRVLAGGSAAAQQGAVLQVTFKAVTTEAQIRASLAAVEGEIIGGPGALGVYSIRVKKGQGLNAISKLMQQQGVVDSATLVQN